MCLSIVILAPSASEVSLGAAGQVALQADPGFPEIRGIAGRMPPSHFLCTGIVLESHWLEIGHPTLLKTYYIA